MSLQMSVVTRLVLMVSLAVIVGRGDHANAAVTTTGVVTPTPPTTGGTYITQLLVGTGNTPTSNNLWGTVAIDNSTVLQYGSLIAGDDEGYFGQVNLVGTGQNSLNTQFNLSGQGTTNNPTVQIGNEGTGNFFMSNAAKMTLTNQNADFALGLTTTGLGYATISDQYTLLTVPETIVVGQSGVGYMNVLNKALVRTTSTSRANYISIGRNLSGIGYATVDGTGTLLQANSSLRVGESGIGTLNITGGGLVQAINGTTPLSGPTPFVVIGANLTGIGSVLVDGVGSRLQVQRDLVVGGLGQGTLTVRNNGVVQIVDKSLSSVVVGPAGRIELKNGILDGSTPATGFGTVVNGYLGGAGTVRGSVFVDEFAFLEARPTDLLQFNGSVSNQGAVTVDGGDMQFLAGFTNNAIGAFSSPGRVSVENSGSIRFSQTLQNDGVLSAANGAPNIYGTINNSNSIVVARDTVASFFGPVTNSGTITVKPGGNALFLADITFVGTSLVELALGEEDVVDQAPQLSTNGAIALDGTLELAFDDFTPQPGQTYELISAGGGISGAFDSIVTPTLPQNLELGLLYSADRLLMEVKLAGSSIGGVPGDYNSDGVVDAGDYTVWRNQLGSTNSLPNDDTPGVGQDDYTRWRTYFGQMALVGSGALVASATPEPTSLMLLVGAAAALVAGYRRPRRGC